MAKVPNLKVNIGADTKDFEKGTKTVKQGLKDLQKTGDSALGALGDAFGVNTGKVGEMTSALTGLGAKMQQAGNTGVKAFGEILQSVGLLGGGIAALGLGVAAAGFKALRDEAENFKSTIDGMNLSMATAAYISTYQQVMHDANRETGKAVAEAMSEWDKGLARFKSNFSATMAGAIADSKWYDAFTPSGFIRSWKQVSEASKEAEAAAERNEARGDRLAELRKQELTLATRTKEAEADIAELTRVVRDTKASDADRAAAQVEAEEKIRQKYAAQIELTREMAAIQVAMDAEAGNSFEQTKHTEEANQRVLELQKQQTQELASLDRYSRSIGNSTSAQAAAWEKARQEAEKIAAIQARGESYAAALSGGLASIDSPGVMAPTLSLSQKSADYFKDTVQAYLGDMTIAVGIEADTQKVYDISNEINSILSSGIARTGELIGNLVGTLAGGGNAWGDFKSAALSSFGDLAIAIGKIAISAGLASEGIKAALKLDNPYIAIAAGAALVALGSAVKSSVSAVANGDYSAGGGGYSSGYSSGSGSGDYDTREVVVNVNGTLEADGDKLIAVINSANNRNYYTQ